ncbi:enoyl-CoA hydratase/isomerase family protein [Parvularcula lutaonensis]|uniref:Enoyl-CoA hydratase/isomerase family protein n=1 Tax=Parvularcula lutaonensis TaxID=491923 RepID=A0ABV7MCJ8_9PROT|nr:enoyl-CoA hydratase-related protein [Parvularcula lutaonensis]GGY50486.1 enoyl-CoA hydratase [Parvularcula lutaonensis]
MTEHVVVEKRDGILHARLNRPEKKNAMTEAMYARLAECFREADSDSEVRVLLLSGEGDSFTSGNDLSTFAAVAAMKMDKNARPAVLDLIQAGIESTTPVVAAVEGWCVGIGATMMLHTDFIYAGEDAKFHMPFTSLGAVPEAGASRLLPRRFGRQRAAEMLILSEVISAEKAHRWGLITDVTENGAAYAMAKQTAERICELPPESVRETKALMREDLEDILPHTVYELEKFAERLVSEEMQQLVAKRMAAKK